MGSGAGRVPCLRIEVGLEDDLVVLGSNAEADESDGWEAMRLARSTLVPGIVRD